MKKITLLLLALLLAGVTDAQTTKRSIHKLQVRPAGYGKDIGPEPVSTALPVKPISPGDTRALDKISMSSSLNANGIFSYDQNFLTVDKTAGMFCYGNRAGGVFGNTGNDLKYKFTTDKGTSWDSLVIAASGGKNFRYPSMVIYNPANSSNPDDMYGIFTGPIYETDWSNQYCGSVKLDGQYQDVNYIPVESGTYLNHMNIDLYCSPDGHATVASLRLNGATGSYTYHGWEILNGTFNPATHKFDWQIPFQKLLPDLKEEGRIDATRIAWSVDGSIGYLMGTAIDADDTWNPYGVEWPVIYKTTDHGQTWTKTPAFDFSSIALFQQWLYPMTADTTKIIPRWYNKWASEDNQQTNGAIVDIHGNLHIFGLVRSTMSTHPDSLNYFYTNEPKYLFDVYMKPGGGWDAMFVDSLRTVNPPDPGSYGISWDHLSQMARTPDGSKVFCVWIDTDPSFSSENLAPDIKGKGYNAVTGMATPVKEFTAQTLYMFENYWMRLSKEVFYDEVNFTSILPVTTSIPGATSDDPLVHQDFNGLEVADNEFSILVNAPSAKAGKPGPQVGNCYPNPFTENTFVKLQLDKPSKAELQVTNVTGERVRTQDLGWLPSGSQKVRISSAGLEPGIYFYTLVIDGTQFSGKMILAGNR